MGKRAENVSIIGGADGPTSIFLIGNKGKRKLKERIRGFFYEKKRQRVKKKITANPHTLEELTDYLKREYGARELSKKSRAYQEQRKSMKEALIVRYRPELLGDLAQIRFPREELSGKGDFSGEECKKALVLHPASSQTITGYSLANLVRASCVLNCHLIFTLSALRLTVHIRTCCLKLSKSGHGFPNAWRLMMPISISAMSSQLPCFGV